MPPRKRPEQSETVSMPARPPARNPRDREQQMIALADGLAEKQLRDGTASSQVMTHYLKLGTAHYELEIEKLRNENLVLEQKRLQMESQARAEDMLGEVLSAMKKYAGVEEEDAEEF